MARSPCGSRSPKPAPGRSPSPAGASRCGCRQARRPRPVCSTRSLPSPSAARTSESSAVTSAEPMNRQRRSRLHRLRPRCLTGAQARHPFATERPAPVAHAVRLDRERLGDSNARPTLQRQQDGPPPIRFGPIRRAGQSAQSRCSAVATTQGRPAMTTPKSSGPSARFCHMWIVQGNPA